MRPVNLVFCIAFTILLGACSSSKLYYQGGDYETAISVAVQKLRKNPNRANDAITLEKAFREAFSKDNDRIKTLRAEGNPDCWVELYEIFARINSRQSKVKTILPIFLKKEFRNIDIPVMDVDKEMAEAKFKAAEYLYAHAANLMTKSDKQSYRKAYDDLGKIKSYYPVFRDADDLMVQCFQKGQNYVQVNFSNRSELMIPKNVEQEILKFDASRFNSTWVRFYTSQDKEGKSEPDYLVNLNINTINIGPERISENHHEEVKIIEDGWVYQYDNRGNVKKDSLGNDIKMPRMITVKCLVRETRQLKEGQIAGNLQIAKSPDKQVLKDIPFSENLLFQNLYTEFNGDQRAMSNETRSRIGGQPAPFPSNIQMVLDASKLMKQRISDNLKRYHYLFLN